MSAATKHKSLRPDRAAVNASERIFAEEWAKINKAVSHVNHGRGALECILLPYVKSPLDPFGYEHVGEISQRDADVAATVIQWLGTHVGQCFLLETIRKIEGTETAREARALPLFADSRG